MIENYEIVSENSESTVVGCYERADNLRDKAFQSEADLERDLIDRLCRQGYEYVDVRSEGQLIENLRHQIERLNSMTFSDSEWTRFFHSEIAADGKGLAEKAQTIQKDHVKVLLRDDESIRNIYLLDKRDIHANSTQVLNQYEAPDGTHPCRYDVTILVNGLPLVHIELKRRGVSIKEAFNQIDRYGRDSFWSGCALFEYVQIFIISNGTLTKYYGNTTRESHIAELSTSKTGHRPQTCNSFEFTSWWADARNVTIPDLTDFTATFLSRHTLLNILTKYCVLTEQKVLMAMRPYQIAATERLLSRIESAHNRRTCGTREAGGYIWHTTGSGKTLTSFKAAQLATRLPFISKVIFVVDRKDLDYQTMKEYDRFQKGAANGNTSTRELQRQIENPSARIIITTIQKLSTFVKKNPQHEAYGRETVIIFDECHRSQFGDMHRDIARKFKKYYIFGFTGTPIFKENITGGGALSTTREIFGDCLHTYTIVDAIRDHNVLPFRVDYVRTIKEKEEVESSKVWDIEREKALMDPKRIHNVTQYIIENFDRHTKRSSVYAFDKLVNISEIASSKGKVKELRQSTRLGGFNSILAVQSIEYAKLYYTEFTRQLGELPPNKRLKIATIFSYAPNEEVEGPYVDGYTAALAEKDSTLTSALAENSLGLGEENSDDTEGLDAPSRDFLERAIRDYNATFSTDYDTSAEKFPNYYKDVSQRMKNREIDLLIVVNMFLTGFDATTLNTLWVDKNLRYHGLLQAFSRTNRILNAVKSSGNIVCFRNLEDSVNKALALFGDKDATGTVILRAFEDYFSGFRDEDGKWVKGYTDYLAELQTKFSPGVAPSGEKAEREFIALMGSILRMSNLLSNFDQFTAKNPLSERDRQDYTSVYLNLADKYRPKSQDKASINDDVEFEMELVKQVEVNIDYILYLVGLYHEGHCEDKELRLKIRKAVDASPDLRDKKELIERFIDELTPGSDVDRDWKEFVDQRKKEEFGKIVREERLQPQKAQAFIKGAFLRGYVPEGGLEIGGILPPLNPFDKAADREGTLHRVIDRLKAFFTKFYDIASGVFGE